MSTEREQPRKKVTPALLRKMKEKGRKVVMLTAYDWLLAGLLEEAGVDILLVGDSAGMVVHGFPDTLPVTMDLMLAHTAAVARAARSAMVVADMPFLSYQVNPDEALRNAGRFLQEAGADGVKLEGGKRVAGLVERLVEAGIPVMGHLGLTPQSVKTTGYSLQGGTEDEAGRLLEEARVLEEAGIFSLVLEKVPASLAEKAASELKVPVIGIGAGPSCDGQVLVTQDMLGLFPTFKPKFVRRYAELGNQILDAVKRFARDVRSGDFPGPKESF